MSKPHMALVSPSRGLTVGLVVAAIAGVCGVVLSFVSAVRELSELGVGDSPSTVLGVPWSVVGIAVFAAILGFAVVLLQRDPSAAPHRRVAMGTTLIIAGMIGLWAGWALTADKVITVTSPQADLDCNFTLLVQCGANLTSWQGSILGFPNPLLGIGGWVAALVMGVALVSAIPLRRALWAWFTLGVTGAMALVIWLISQSIFVLGTLCPWCMVTWAVTIPVFWLCWAELLRRSPQRRLAAAAGAVLGWIPLLTVASYLVVAIIAQLRLDVIAYL
ncbi:vitamin K epoxide reductase family protein [Homoserinimonas hongtaonis]|uniref:vitamin K epoxide reductase family protein n=1 Tax=Homoserinimonas hongtaonis TaxID=2079791 RepID=UPI001F53E432|nr:vitamin K epoxide reductase family protein [Salinibacterium hongtaonis]